jgi:hypothetical protein
MTVRTHALVEQYLKRLDGAARSLPRQEREELLSQIREHLAVGLPTDASEADVRNVLDDLGDPDDIVAAARPDGPAAMRGPREIFAVLLLFTGFPPLLGWLAGLGLLLWSPLWTVRQKLLGALVWPGGAFLILGAGVIVPTAQRVCGSATPVQVRGAPTTLSTVGSVALSCTSSGGSFPWAAVGLVVALVAGLLVSIYLYRAAGRNTVTAH